MHLDMNDKNTFIEEHLSVILGWQLLHYSPNIAYSKERSLHPPHLVVMWQCLQQWPTNNNKQNHTYRWFDLVVAHCDDIEML